MSANHHALNGTDDPAAVLVAVATAAQMLGIGRTKAYELIDAGELELVHIGRSALIPTDSVHDFVRRLRAEASAAKQSGCPTRVVELRSSPSGDSQPPAA